MIVIPVGNYKLTQIEGSGIITIKKKGKFENKVLGLLADDKAKAIIFELGR